jgi:TonB family protein
MIPALAFGQGGQGANASTGRVAPAPPPPVRAPRPTIAPTRKVDPIYPAKARRAGIQGDVWLDLIVLAGGSVKSVTIARSLDTVYGLDQAAIAAVRQWRYPPLTDGRSSRPPLRAVVSFRLPNAPPPVAAPAVEAFGKGAFRPSGFDPRVARPTLVHRVAPVYTSAGLRARITGTVELEAVVLTDGTVGQVRVVKSLDKPTGLDDQPAGAAREWTFEPGKLDGKPVPMIVLIRLAFTLH